MMQTTAANLGEVLNSAAVERMDMVVNDASATLGQRGFAKSPDTFDWGSRHIGYSLFIFNAAGHPDIRSLAFSFD